MLHSGEFRVNEVVYKADLGYTSACGTEVAYSCLLFDGPGKRYLYESPYGMAKQRSTLITVDYPPAPLPK